jgi:diguanylate cyclase (GGDEF)-like protein
MTEGTPEAALSRADHSRSGSASRDVNNSVLANLVAELDQQGGEALVERVRLRAGEERSPAELTFLLGWSSLEQVTALLRAAVEETGDPDVAYRAGQQTFKVLSGAGAEIVARIRELGSPEVLYQWLGPTNAKVSAVTDAEALEVTDHRAVVRYVTRAPHVRDPLMCRYLMGTLSSFTTVFGFGFAEVAETECQALGDPACVCEVTWGTRAPGTDQAEARIAALEARVELLTARFKTVGALSRDLAAGMDIEEVLETVVKLAMTAVTAPYHLLAVQLPGERLPRVHAAGLGRGKAQGLAAEVLSGRGDRGGAGAGRAARSSWPGQRVVVDVASSRRRYGSLVALCPPGQEFFPDDAQILMAYAGTAASSLDAAVALEETRLLLELSATMAEITTPDESARRIARAALRTISSDRAAVLLWEPQDRLLGRAAVAEWRADGPSLVDAGGPVAAGRRCQLDVCSVDEETLGQWTASSPALPRFSQDDPAVLPMVRSVGCDHGAFVPIVACQELLGAIVLGLRGNEGREEKAEVAHRLGAVANLAAPALYSARLLSVVEYEANHDPLTDLPNARLLDDRLSLAIAQARRSGSVVGLLFVDLDGFKQVNDRFGHTEGDRVLRATAKVLCQTMREGDTVARVGGDEFVVLLSGLDSPADATAGRRRVQEALSFTTVAVAGEELVLSASIGTACFPEDGTSADDLLRRADGAMYTAKVAHRVALGDPGHADMPGKRLPGLCDTPNTHA